MKDWMIYQKIQEMKRDKLNRSQVARKLEVDYKTVTKYWSMTPEGFLKATNRAARRKRKADDYEEYVLGLLRKYPDMSASQIYDWIMEREGAKSLPFKPRAFRNYVASLRKEHNIPKPESGRQYEAVEDPPMGKQAQVDMGEISLETTSGRRKKVYVFAMVLSHSRYKYALWQDRPWTTPDFVEAHIKAFRFLGGRPEEIVYDQDSVLSVSENHGELILTEGFQNYVDTIGFKVHVCHGADPESKGRIENVIKYLKHGFAEHRTLTTIEELNAECISWLERTGNAQEHGTTKKIPSEVFASEKEYLIPVSEYSFEKPSRERVSYQVRKDNTVLYKSNRYRVPVGTYKKGRRVYVVTEGDDITITDVESGVLYARHPICYGKGELVGDRKNRDKSKTLLELEDAVLALFGGSEEARRFLEKIHVEKRRYYRDQLGVIKSLFEEWRPEILLGALSYCVERELYAAGELASAAAYVASLKDEAEAGQAPAPQIPEKYKGWGPQVRDLGEYERALGDTL